MVNKHKKFFPSFRAQTATELAVFGAILIFVIGLIVRYALDFKYNQDKPLKAMRAALGESFLSAEKGSSARSFANTLVIDDRKEVLGDTRYGTSDRSPVESAGAGVFSKHLFRILLHGETDQLPLVDFYINGKHLTFTTADFGDKDLAGDITSQPKDCFDPPDRPGVKCAVYYTRIANEDPRFCSYSRPGCTPAEMDKRFDLNQDGTTDVLGPPSQPVTLRNNFAWQWYPVKMIAPNVNFETGDFVSLDVDGDFKEEQILKFEDELGNVYDIENNTAESGPFEDRRTRQILDLGAVITKIWFVSSQKGDVDFSYNSVDARKGVPRPGLQPGLITYSLKKDGTYFVIEEGKLYSADKQFIRHAQKRDRIDVVERRMQLSNDTDRMCKAPLWNPTNGPIEVFCGTKNGSCGGSSCCYGSNIFKTCFDRSCKMLYIRSRISDKGGRKWVTDVSSDEMLIK